jgi:hypothetical protein
MDLAAKQGVPHRSAHQVNGQAVWQSCTDGVQNLGESQRKIAWHKNNLGRFLVTRLSCAAGLFGRATLGDDPAAQTGNPAASIQFFIFSRHSPSSLDQGVFLYFFKSAEAMKRK